jgi:sarcosine oxidase subunit gamma
MDDIGLARAATVPLGVTLVPGPAYARHVLRVRRDAIEAVGVAFGVGLPLDACRARTQEGRSALWLGPDEYLLLSPAGGAAAIEAAFEAAMGGGAYALVDVSHRQTGFVVAGAKAEALLNAECPLDLRASAFPVGMCTRTLFGRAEIVLWRQADQAFYLECWRSFAGYVGELASLVATEPDL